MEHDADVVIVGAGLAGLAAARRLHRAGRQVVVLEAANEAGGRVGTDLVDGYRLDRGFQVLNPAYPALRRFVDVPQLRLHRFWRGVRVIRDGRSVLLGHPADCPKSLLDVAGGRAVSWRDLIAVAALSARDLTAPARLLTGAADQATAAELDRWGLSPAIVRDVLRPFLTGVFLEPDLATSSRFFHLVWRAFLRQAPGLPADGMAALPRLLAAPLPDGAVRLASPVRSVAAGRVDTESGDTWRARAVIVATDGSAAADLMPGLPQPRWHGVRTWYFSTDEPPGTEPVIHLGPQPGPLTNAAVISAVCPSYAPPGRSLVSASSIGDPTTGEVRAALAATYRTSTERWTDIARYDIPHALPAMTAPHPLRAAVRVADGLYVCGDHRDTSSLQGALASGSRTGLAVLSELDG